MKAQLDNFLKGLALELVLVLALGLVLKLQKYIHKVKQIMLIVATDLRSECTRSKLGFVGARLQIPNIRVL